MSVFASFDEALGRATGTPDELCHVTIRPASDLTDEDRARWASLWARCGHGNIFAADWFMASGLAHHAASRAVRLAVLHTASGAWLGVLPLVFEGLFGPWPWRALRNWRCPRQCDASPLIEPGAEHLFWHTLLGDLDHLRGAIMALSLEDLPLDDPATRALIEVCLADGRRLEQVGRFSRPMLAHFGSCDAAPESVSPARRELDQWLDGHLRNLEQEVGQVRFVAHARGENLADWIERFLALEQPGCQLRGAAALFRDVITAAVERGEARLMRLDAGGQVIAMTSCLLRQGRGYGFGTAVDAAFARYAPDRLLMRAVDDQAARGPAVLFDSGVWHDAPDDPLWPQAREIAHYALPIGGRARRRAFAAITSARTAFSSKAK